MFSSRTGWDRTPTELARALERRPTPPQLDLSSSNPTRVGFAAKPELLAGLSDPRLASYEPAATGRLDPRQAICEYYERRGSRCEPDQLWLAASTSEIYLHLLALLCEPGQAVAVPSPGYPLFDFIGDVAGVELRTYPVAYDGRWHLDLGRLREIVAEPSVRAIVCVAPGNPCGNYLQQTELEQLEAICLEHGIALIVDEVFSDFALRNDPDRVKHVVGSRRCATFVLSGLSKIAALPQLKLSWGVACGPAEIRTEAMQRLALLADTFLSASGPAQHLVRPALAAAPLTQAAILQRTRANLASLRERLADSPLSVLDVEGGWSAVLRLPALARTDVGWALEFLEQDDVLVQPGSLFGLPAAHIVVSLLTPPLTMIDGVDLLAKRVARVLA